MYLIKKNIKNLKRIRGGDHRNKTSNNLFLDRNERIIPFDKKTQRDLEKIISKVNLGNYPNLDLFYSKLAKWLRISKKKIFVTEGLDGAIQSVFKSFTIEHKSNIIIPHPSFSMYKVYAKLFNVKTKIIDYDKNYNINFNNIFKIADKNTSIIFLPNPNMPIEGFLNSMKIEKIAKFCEKNKIILFIDEVYFHFSNNTSIKLINKYKNIIVARSFSKAFGLAGIRLGYLVSNFNHIKYISNTRSGYESNSTSLAITSYFLDNFHIVTKYVNQIKQGLKYLKYELKKNDIEFTSGNKGNFVFIKLQNHIISNKIYKYLIKKNIYVRSGWEKPFDNYICVSGSNKNNMKFFLNNFLKAKKHYE